MGFVLVPPESSRGRERERDHKEKHKAQSWLVQLPLSRVFWGGKKKRQKSAHVLSRRLRMPLSQVGLTFVTSGGWGRGRMPLQHGLWGRLPKKRGNWKTDFQYWPLRGVIGGSSYIGRTTTEVSPSLSLSLSLKGTISRHMGGFVAQILPPPADGLCHQGSSTTCTEGNTCHPTCSASQPLFATRAPGTREPVYLEPLICLSSDGARTISTIEIASRTAPSADVFRARAKRSFLLAVRYPFLCPKRPRPSSRASESDLAVKLGSAVLVPDTGVLFFFCYPWFNSIWYLWLLLKKAYS